MCECCGHSSNKKFVFYIIAIVLGIVCGLSNIEILHQIGKCCSEIFIKIFKCISMPVISLSVIVALSTYGAEKSMNKVWKKTLKYTFGTTLVAACVSALLYIFISPNNAGLSFDSNLENSITTDYLKYLLDIIPDNIFGAFVEHKVLTVLLISVIIGISARSIKQTEAKNAVLSFFNGLHSIFFTITKFIVKVLPIGLFGFITVSVLDLKSGMSAHGMGKYFLVIILSNLVQGLIILPLWLMSKKINPFSMFKSMFSALSVAFFSKSSSGALPITMEAMESKLGVKKEISRFVLPLCTTINMNGCAAFIFTTVIYIMQNYGIDINYSTILTWIIIATIAAIGNAGIPMGCFFLSASLLSSMNIPMPLLGMILPVYSVLDMLETSLNVWSDSCVTVAVSKSKD
ncbi:MAG: dicarboxylate/amino acid:cation symporter [Alphaproteobacteria bacterium]|nr:dicarboxylate/amino acid:cation symporter [Alphaproteobacteria bacterium]